MALPARHACGQFARGGALARPASTCLLHSLRWTALGSPQRWRGAGPRPCQCTTQSWRPACSAGAAAAAAAVAAAPQVPAHHLSSRLTPWRAAACRARQVLPSDPNEATSAGARVKRRVTLAARISGAATGSWARRGGAQPGLPESCWKRRLTAISFGGRRAAGAANGGRAP